MILQFHISNNPGAKSSKLRKVEKFLALISLWRVVVRKLKKKKIINTASSIFRQPKRNTFVLLHP